jgi:ubiquinone/menaquinone biosynthesis C-methylase UbiE
VTRSGSNRQHYSYAKYADPRTADTFDETRFGGPIGALVAEAQERAIFGALPPLAGLAALDVGTGTGRAALALARSGARVTGVDASRQMLRVAARRATAEGLRVTLSLADAHHLSFSDRAFDVVLCLRVLMHTPDWRQSLRELARVTRGRLAIDYPRRSSVAALQSAWRRMLSLGGVETEPYRVLADSAVAQELAQLGFRIVSQHRQFVLPIALHRQIGSRALTNRVEKALEAVGLLARFGSPVTIVAERCAS